jgi:hypothetical protein
MMLAAGDGRQPQNAATVGFQQSPDIYRGLLRPPGYRVEWVNLKRNHPETFEEAKRYEKSALEHGSPFTWPHGESLLGLEKPERVAQVESDFAARKAHEQSGKPQNPLRPLKLVQAADIDDLYGEDQGGGACLVCHRVVETAGKEEGHDGRRISNRSSCSAPNGRGAYHLRRCCAQ